MRKLKKLLVFLCLAVGCACCFCSCSCSKTPGTGNPPDETPTGPDLGSGVYYNVSITISGADGSGTIVSSTGSNRHKSGSSPTYSVIPSRGYAIESVSLNNEMIYTHLVSGYKEEPLTVNVDAISKNTTINASFIQMEYVVNLEVNGDTVGGTVASSTGSNTHLGASSPTYTVTPNDGYCVYALNVDGEKIYHYKTDYLANQQGATQSYLLSEPFEVIADDHTIEVEFRKLVDIDDVEIEGLYFSNVGSGVPDVRDDGTYLVKGLSVITHPTLDNFSSMPTGTQQIIKLQFSDEAGIVFDDVQIQISLDGGESYLDPFDSKFNHYLFDYGISYDATKQTITIDEMVEGFKLKVVGTPRKVDLVIYNYDEEETQEVSDLYLFSYYTIPAKGYYWYYCLTDDYHLTNLYINAEIDIVETGMGEELHRILLDVNLLQVDENDVAQSNIVLIFSSNELTK